MNVVRCDNGLVCVDNLEPTACLTLHHAHIGPSLRPSAPHPCVQPSQLAVLGLIAAAASRHCNLTVGPYNKSDASSSASPWLVVLVSPSSLLGPRRVSVLLLGNSHRSKLFSTCSVDGVMPQ